MNKLKNVFQRSQKSTEDRRPQQFVKRHTSLKAHEAISPAVQTDSSPPTIDLSELSEMEKPFYESWWKDLDPFDLKKINNETIIKFLNGCSLEDDKLEQILTLFEDAKDGLNKLQFFAMLRLIAHAQNGRKISKALIYLGAPIPYFHTSAINAIINAPLRRSSKDDSKSSSSHSDRKTWWGFEKEQQAEENRRSYIGPFTTHTPIPNQHTPSYNNNNNNTNLIDYFYNNITPLSNDGNNWANNNDNNSMPVINTNAEVKQQHSRSRSEGTAADFLQAINTNPYQQQEELHSSRSSLSLNELNSGQSLLLTQKFVYQSPSIRNQQLNANNPFMVSPFDDNNTPTDEYPINHKPNSKQIAPPPVPSQSTKPAFPKYTRTNTFSVRRSQSTNEASHHHKTHQRHKSTTDTIFY